VFISYNSTNTLIYTTNSLAYIPLIAIYCFNWFTFLIKILHFRCYF